MTVSGRLSVDALVHDTTGTTSLKALSLESSESVTTGKVAIVTGTCGTSAVSIAVAPSTYFDSAGSAVTFATVTRVVLQGSAALKFTSSSVTAYSGTTQCAAFALNAHTTAAVNVAAVTGTATYTILLVGT